MHPYFPNAPLIRSAFGTKEFHYELVQAVEYRHFVFRLDQFYHVCVHASLPSARRRHVGGGPALSAPVRVSKMCWPYS